MVTNESRATVTASYDMNASASMDDSRLLTPDEIARVFSRIKSRMKHGGTVVAHLRSSWSSDLRWARNRASMTSDRRDISLALFRSIREGHAWILLNQLDDESIDHGLAASEALALREATHQTEDFRLPRIAHDQRETTIWSDPTFNRSVEDSAKVIQQLTRGAEKQKLMSAGFLEVQAATWNRFWVDKYARETTRGGKYTQAQCTVTVRHPKGDGSGWAGVSRYDINRVSESDIAKRALDKCVASLNAVRIEPGRYTVILEPQAVADLTGWMIEPPGSAIPLSRPDAEDPGKPSPFYLGEDQSVSKYRSKLGLKIVDERITIEHNPEDPELGIVALPGTDPVTWVKNGVLTELNFDQGYALSELNQLNYNARRASYRMSGGTVSIDEMISTTQRGLLVTRFYGLSLIDPQSLLVTGVTRDGLFLIENGVVTKPVRNFRFTESPLFVLNNVVDLGVPEAVYAPFPPSIFTMYFPEFALTQVIVPPIKANDFSFTSTIDAI